MHYELWKDSLSSDRGLSSALSKSTKYTEVLIKPESETWGGEKKTIEIFICGIMLITINKNYSVLSLYEGY